MGTVEERVAALRAQRELDRESVQRLERELKVSFDAMRADISDIKKSLHTRTGFVAGVASTVSLVWAVVLAGVAIIWNTMWRQ